MKNSWLGEVMLKARLSQSRGENYTELEEFKYMKDNRVRNAGKCSITIRDCGCWMVCQLDLKSYGYEETRNGFNEVVLERKQEA
jgi:hypothetical protein